MFQGKDGFVWWFGLVESNSDSEGLGRCKVRIVGWHNENDQELPTDALPYAYPILPVNTMSVAGNGQSTVGPQPGTRVFGFFADGLDGQTPIMLGTVPGTSVREFTKKLESGSTPYQPLLNKLFGGHKSREEHCPEGHQKDTTNVNIQVPDQTSIKINPGEWVLPYTGFVSSAYNESRGSGTHNGVDICPAGFFEQTDPGAAHLGGRLRGQTGLPVYSAAKGIVTHIWTADEGQRGVKTSYDKTGQGSRSFGNAIAIKHVLSTGTYTTIYAHLGVNQDAGKDQPGAGINVSVGDSVSKGQQIGTVGRSHVWDSLTHLHFEIRIGDALPKANNHINPGRVFPQLRGRHLSFLGTANTSKYDISPLPYRVKDAPVKALQPPKE